MLSNLNLLAFIHILTLAHASVLHHICWVIQVRNAKLSGWNLVVCGTERHPYQRLSVAAARPVYDESSRSNEAKPSYAVYPQTMQQQPHLQPAIDFRAVYMGPCRKPTTRYGSTLMKNGNSGGKAATVCEHEMLRCLLSTSIMNLCYVGVVLVSAGCTMSCNMSLTLGMNSCMLFGFINVYTCGKIWFVIVSRLFEHIMLLSFCPFSLYFLSYLLTSLLVYFLTYLSTSFRIGPFRFQAGGRRRRPNLASFFGYAVHLML